MYNATPMNVMKFLTKNVLKQHKVFLSLFYHDTKNNATHFLGK